MRDTSINVTPAERDALADVVQARADWFGVGQRANELSALASTIRSSGTELDLDRFQLINLSTVLYGEAWSSADVPWNKAPAELRAVLATIDGVSAFRNREPKFVIDATPEDRSTLQGEVSRYQSHVSEMSIVSQMVETRRVMLHLDQVDGPLALTGPDLLVLEEVISINYWGEDRDLEFSTPGEPVELVERIESAVRAYRTEERAVERQIDGDRVNFAMQEPPFRDTSQPLSPLDELGVIRATDAERAALAPYVERYIAHLEDDMQAPEWVVAEARQTLLQVTAPNTEIRVSSTDRKVLDDLVQVEEWAPDGAAVAPIPEEIRGVVERIMSNIERAKLLDRATQSVEAPSLPTPQEVATALDRAKQGARVDDPRLTRYAELVETTDWNLSFALDSPTLIGHIENQIRQAKGGLEGLVRPGTEEDRVDAIGFAKVVHASLLRSGDEVRNIARPTWWDYEAVAAARHVDWSPLAQSPAEGLLVGIRGASPEADTLRKARSAALVEVRFDQRQKLVAAPDYPQPVPDVFALGAYTWQISTPAEMFTTEGYPWVELLARELELTPVPDTIGLGRDFTPAEQAQAKVFIAALSEELAARGYPVDASNIDLGHGGHLGHLDSELEVAAHARDLGGTVEAMWEAGCASRLEAGHAWATAEPAAQDDIAKQVLTEKVATYAEVQQLTATVRAAKPTDERLFSDFDTVSAEPLARQGERAMERLAWIAGRWDGLDPVIQDGIDRVGAMTAELSAVPSLQPRSTNDVRETRSPDWTRTADAGVIGLERAQTEQGLAALQRPEQTREAPTRAAQAPAPDADERLSESPRPRGLTARIEAEVARRTPPTPDRTTDRNTSTRSR